jgi:hypothetical protein
MHAWAARRALKAEGYQGTPLDDLYRDEVQDFTQAELLMDLRCALRTLRQIRHPASELIIATLPALSMLKYSTRSLH